MSKNDDSGTGISSTYAYDIDGIRSQKTANAITTDYVTDHNRDYAQVIKEISRDATSIIHITDYLYGDDLIKQSQNNASEKYYLYDGLGSTRALTDISGEITDSYNYEAFGSTLNKTGSTENNYLFTGEQYDANLDNYYLRARYYNQKAGRFTQQDSYQGNNADPVTLHKYIYSNADPVNMIDPSGKFGIASIMAAVNVSGILSTTAIGKVANVFDIELTGGRTARQTGTLYLLGSSSPATQKLILMMSNKVDAVDQVNMNPVRGATHSIEKLDGLTPEFKTKARQVLNELNKKGHNLRIVWGKRTREQNDTLVRQGNASRNSNHLTGTALDFISRVFCIIIWIIQYILLKLQLQLKGRVLLGVEISAADGTQIILKNRKNRMIKNILSAGLVLFFSSSIVIATETSGMLWMSKSQSLVAKGALFTYQVEVYRNIGIDHGSDSVQIKIYKGDTTLRLIHTIPLTVPAIKGYVRDVSFVDINNDRMVISFDIEMKAMDGLILKEVVLVGVNGKIKTVIEAKGVDLYQDL